MLHRELIVPNFFSSNLIIAALGYVARKFTVIPLHRNLRVTARMMHNYRKKIIQVQCVKEKSEK